MIKEPSPQKDPKPKEEPHLSFKIETSEELSGYIFSLNKATELIGVALESVATWKDSSMELQEIAVCLQWLSKLNQKLQP